MKHSCEPVSNCTTYTLYIMTLLNTPKEKILLLIKTSKWDAHLVETLEQLLMQKYLKEPIFCEINDKLAHCIINYCILFQQVTNPATRPLPDLPGQRSDIPVQRSHDHHRLRRDSFLQSLNNGPTDNSGQQRSPDTYNTSAHSSQGAHSSSHRSNSTQSVPRMDQRLPPRGDHSVRNVERWLENSVMESQGPPPRRRMQSDRSDHSDHVPSPSPPGSYHSDEEIPYR